MVHHKVSLRLSHLTVLAQCDFNLSKKKILLTVFLFVTLCSFRLESDDLPFRGDIRPVLQVRSSAHSMVGFANDAFVGNLDQPVTILFLQSH